MTYKELQQIINEQIKLQHTTLPIDSFSIATHLGLTVKNSIQCKIDYQGKSPLINANAVYALNNGEYTIYYDEKYSYKNFAIAHEIAHHLLGHMSDGAIQHHDANLMAAIMIAPKELILTNGINNAYELSNLCCIPISTAIEYWNALDIEQETSIADYLKQIKITISKAVKLLNHVYALEGGVENE